MSARDEVAAKLRVAAKALESASRHCQIAASHAEVGEIPRMAAHVLATHGDLVSARDELDDIARLHADHAET